VEAVVKPESFPIDKIYVPEMRMKALNRELVQEIAESILAIGQQAPILVRPHKDRFVLVEGLHRLEACKALGERAIIGLLVSAEAARQKPLASDVGEAERQKMERLKKLRLEKEAAEQLANPSRSALETEAATRQREHPEKTIRGNRKATSKQSPSERLGSTPRTLSDWIKRERDGGRY
jgi:ParB-like chromosome segregation protein Spo0J